MAHPNRDTVVLVLTMMIYYRSEPNVSAGITLRMVSAISHRLQF